MRHHDSTATSSSALGTRRSRSAFRRLRRRQAARHRRHGAARHMAVTRATAHGRPAGAPSQAQRERRVAFTVSLLVATLAFDGAQLEEAEAGILAAAVGAAAVTWLVFRIIGLLVAAGRIAAVLGGAQPLLDLEFAVDAESDHIRGPLDARVPVVEYGDFECP